jgi:hypothetical protein
MTLIRFSLTLFIFFAGIISVSAQPDRWQQKVDYVMNVDMDVKNHQYKGDMSLKYTNNSPDALEKVFFHLYFNAFQPGSMMDVRSLNIIDPDGRVGSRISKLKADEQGWTNIKSLSMNGQKCSFETNETILEVTLPSPIQPNSTVSFEVKWDAQVPLQIRRSGRDNSEGIDFSMTQWYPKLCEYDYQGWHANPYIAREFYGVWGDYDVTINIDKKYVLAAGGVLQNPQEVGCGYEATGSKLNLPSGDTFKWHFKTLNVHDFAWAADPDYRHVSIKADDGTTMRFFWQGGKGYDEAWEKLPAIMNRARTLMNERCGKYPYPEYSFIQGGDGGMEYPMATLLTGKRPLGSLVGTAVHEQLHSWYQMILGTNESLYGWMDEGFTSWAEGYVENELAREGLMGNKKPEEQYWAGSLRAYTALATSGKEEPLTTHADHFNTNYGYSLAAYVKGAVFLTQLEYILGKTAFDKGIQSYFDTWKFKHPNTNDCIRIFEKQSGLELDWYKEDWVNTLHTIDYGIQSVEAEGRKNTKVTIGRIGRMAMPLDIVVTYENGDQEMFYAPLESMRGAKAPESKMERTTLPDHRWVDPEFSFEIPSKMKKITKIQIDPSLRMADVDLKNNVWVKE